jgi:dipeptidyl aminopeptidase/acylaminoacyl peptidase
VSLAWSPDGSSIAWLRTWNSDAGNYQEIVTVDVATGKERQITREGKNIDEVYWLPQGDILFSSNREGPSNLWMISGDGGTPRQITNGPGPDLGIKASRDGTRVLYLQQADFGAVMVGDADGRNATQITPDDQAVSFLQFSPDGRQIAFLVNDPDPIKPFRYLYLVDRDGHNRRQLVTEKSLIEDFAWSRDGKKIAMTVHVNAEVDSAHRIQVIDVTDPTLVSAPGNGRVLSWSADGTSLIVRSNSFSWSVPVQGGKRDVLDPDSSYVFPSPDGRSLCLIKGGDRKIKVSVKPVNKPPKVLMDDANRGGGFMRWLPDGKGIVLRRNDELWTLSVETGKAQRYSWNATDAIAFDDLSADGKHSVYVKKRMNAKLILINNFH